MSNPVLQSEHFERAAANLTHAMQQFPGPNFQGTVDQFQRSVDKFVTALGMHWENESRKRNGLAMAYDDCAFDAI